MFLWLWKERDFPTVILKNKPFKCAFFYHPFPVSSASQGMCLNRRQMQAYTLHSTLMDVLEDLKVHSSPLQMFFPPKHEATSDSSVHPRRTGVHEYKAHSSPCLAFSGGHHPGNLERRDTTLKDWLSHGKTPKRGDRNRNCAIFCHSQFQTTAITGNNSPEGSLPTATFYYRFADPCKPGQGQFGPMQVLM